jgi:hypothetical protein
LKSSNKQICSLFNFLHIHILIGTFRIWEVHLLIESSRFLLKLFWINQKFLYSVGPNPFSFLRTSPRVPSPCSTPHVRLCCPTGACLLRARPLPATRTPPLLLHLAPALAPNRTPFFLFERPSQPHFPSLLRPRSRDAPPFPLPLALSLFCVRSSTSMAPYVSLSSTTLLEPTTATASDHVPPLSWDAAAHLQLRPLVGDRPHRQVTDTPCLPVASAGCLRCFSGRPCHA